jgi:hypothetical protein
VRGEWWADAPAAQRCVEIRCYELKPGTAVEFDRLVTGESVPMLRRHGIDVLAFGPSLRVTIDGLRRPSIAAR